MHGRYFESFKSKLTFLSIFSWVISVLFTIQNKLLRLGLKSYLSYNVRYSTKLNSVTLFWFILWLFTFLSVKFFQQIMLYLYVLVSGLIVFSNFFLNNKNTSNLNRMVALVALYAPVKVFFKNIRQFWFYFNYFVAVATWLALIVGIAFFTN